MQPGPHVLLAGGPAELSSDKGLRGVRTGTPWADEGRCGGQEAGSEGERAGGPCGWKTPRRGPAGGGAGGQDCCVTPGESNAGLPSHALTWPPLGDLGPEARSGEVSAPGMAGAVRVTAELPGSPQPAAQLPWGSACCGPQGWGPSLALWTRDMGTSRVRLRLAGRGAVRSCGAGAALAAG